MFQLSTPQNTEDTEKKLAHTDTRDSLTRPFFTFYQTRSKRSKIIAIRGNSLKHSLICIAIRYYKSDAVELLLRLSQTLRYWWQHSVRFSVVVHTAESHSAVLLLPLSQTLISRWSCWARLLVGVTTGPESHLSLILLSHNLRYCCHLLLSSYV